MNLMENEILNRRINENEEVFHDGIIEEEKVESVGTLVAEDFPKLFRGLENKEQIYAHPDDYKYTNEPIIPQIFLYKAGVRIKIFMRVSFQIAKDRYISATFVCDTSCIAHFLISDKLKLFLKERIHKSDVGPDYLKTNLNGENVECVVKDDVPKSHQPANIIGLPMFFLLGIQFPKQRLSTFNYDEQDVAYDVASFTEFSYI